MPGFFGGTYDEMRHPLLRFALLTIAALGHPVRLSRDAAGSQG
jgi:hypothetical protein